MSKSTHTTEYRGDTKSYRSEFGKAIKTNDAFNKSMRGAAQGVAAIDGPLGGISSRISSVNSLLSSGNVLLAASGVAMAALSAATYKSVKVFDEYEKSQLRTEALLKSTGYAVGFTSEQLSDQADSVALATLASVEGIRQAQGVLLTFKTVQGDTFKQATMLAQDMAAVFGGSAKDKALQLGKALESPIDGLNALKRSGVSFTNAERERIKVMQESGDLTGAQTEIIKKLKEQIGGAGAAEAGGLSGSTDTLGQRWDELLLSWGKTSGSASVAVNWINSISNAVKGLREQIDPTAQGLEEKLAKLESARKNGGRGRSAAANRSAIDSEIAALKQQIIETKAAQGDVDSLNVLLAQTASKIDEINAKIPNASSDRKGSGRNKQRFSDKELLEKQLNEQLEIQKKYNLQLQEIEDKKTQHQETQLQLKLAREAEVSAAKLEVQKKQQEKQQAITAKQQEAENKANDALVANSRKRYQAIYDEHIKANLNETQLEELRYSRQQELMQRELDLIREKGRLTQEIQDEFDAATILAKKNHANKLNNIEANQLENNKGFWANYADSIRETATNTDQLWADTLSNFSRTTASHVMQSIDEWKGFGHFVESVARSVARTFVQSLIEIGVQRATLWALEKTINTASATGYVAQITGQAQAASLLAGINTFASTAAIPIVGPAAAPAASAAAISATQPMAMAASAMAASSLAGMAHSGITEVPREGTWLLDEGERVYTNESAEKLDTMYSQIMSKNSSNNVTVENINLTVVTRSYEEVRAEVSAVIPELAAKIKYHINRPS